MRLDQFKPRWRFVESLVKLVNISDHVLFAIGVLLADFIECNKPNALTDSCYYIYTKGISL